MPTYFDFTVTLNGIKPPIWRRFLLHNAATFHELHMAIQESFGWENCHLYEFTTAERMERPIAGSPRDDGHAHGKPASEADPVKLSSYFGGAVLKCSYTYDFGDSWEHEVKLERVIENKVTFNRRLDGGARACPPEDIGGVWGYENAIHALRTGGDSEEDGPEELKKWLDGWDPEVFDLEKIKKAFDMKVGRRLESRGCGYSPAHN